jgi:hypothetical protein
MIFAGGMIMFTGFVLSILLLAVRCEQTVCISGCGPVASVSARGACAGFRSPT